MHQSSLFSLYIISSVCISTNAELPTYVCSLPTYMYNHVKYSLYKTENNYLVLMHLVIISDNHLAQSSLSCLQYTLLCVLVIYGVQLTLEKNIALGPSRVALYFIDQLRIQRGCPCGVVVNTLDQNAGTVGSNPAKGTCIFLFHVYFK